jgi:hypothetical protein
MMILWPSTVKRRIGIGVVRSKGHITCHTRDLAVHRRWRIHRGCQTQPNLSFWIARHPPRNSKLRMFLTTKVGEQKSTITTRVSGGRETGIYLCPLLDMTFH